VTWAFFKKKESHFTKRDIIICMTCLGRAKAREEPLLSLSRVKPKQKQIKESQKKVSL
jgi:hypothetical protein